MSEATEGSETLISPVPEEKQTKRGWAVSLNGQPVPEANHVRISSKFGVLEYGMTPGGWDGWAFHENGGGGSVIVPHVVIDDVLWVGVVDQKRDNQGGIVPNLPRGFLSPGERHFQAANREFQEEVGTSNPVDIFPLDGEPMNANSAFFVTATKGEGVKIFGARINPETVEKSGDGYAFRAGCILADQASAEAKAAEGILKCRFVHWTDALKIGDMFSVAGVGRLLAHLAKK